jgi:polar amino acid transport system permease protein
MITTSIIEQVAGAQRASRRRFSATFAATWLVLVGLIGAGMWIASGAEFDFVLTSGPVIVLQGAGTTVLVSALSIFFATMLALFGALARLSRTPVLNAIGSFYVSLFRGTPLLLQIYFMYFALPQLGIVLPAIAAGVTALSLNYGAYMTEIFRAGIQAVPRGQREAAEALGMPERLVMRRIVLPQAVRIVIPAIGNEFIAMIKDSALVSIITVHETLFLAQRIGRSAFEPVAALLIAGAVYWTLTIIFSFFQERLERRLARSDR